MSTSKLTVEKLSTECAACGKQDDLLEKSESALDSGKQKLKAWSAEASGKLMGLKKTLPKDREAWGKVVRDPKHPFTAALLTALVLILSEASGFGIFMAATWILGNLVLNPLGWILIPLIVAIVLHNRKKFRLSRVQEMKAKPNEID